jgi:hypothetical protein
MYYWVHLGVIKVHSENDIGSGANNLQRLMLASNNNSNDSLIYFLIEDFIPYMDHAELSDELDMLMIDAHEHE